MLENKKTILIVEDEKSIRHALGSKLAHEEFDLFEASNGEEGLETAFKSHPDLILLDVLMPKMDGITMLKKLREDEWGKKAKVIMLTNLSSNEDVIKALELGSFEYLVKSNWSIEDLVNKIKEKI